MTLGDVQVAGGASDAETQSITTLLRGELHGIGECYGRVLRYNSGVGGQVDLTMVIGGAGRARVQSTRGLEEVPEVGQCIASAMRRVVFPEPRRGDLRIEVSFHFRAG